MAPAARAATFVALLTSPVLFTLLYSADGWSVFGALIGHLHRRDRLPGLIDIVAHRLIPRPSLYGADKTELSEDARARRRVWYWRKKFRHTLWIVGMLFTLLLLHQHRPETSPATRTTWPARCSSIGGVFGGQNSQNGSARCWCCCCSCRCCS